jgi:hypothetical protein
LEGAVERFTRCACFLGGCQGHEAEAARTTRCSILREGNLYDATTRRLEQLLENIFAHRVGQASDEQLPRVFSHRNSTCQNLLFEYANDTERVHGERTRVLTKSPRASFHRHTSYDNWTPCGVKHVKNRCDEPLGEEKRSVAKV